MKRIAWLKNAGTILQRSQPANLCLSLTVEVLQAVFLANLLSSAFAPHRLNQAAYSLVVNLIIPGTPMLSLVAVFINEHHPDVLDPPRNSGSSSSRHLGAFEAQLAADMETDVCSTSGMSSSSNQAPSSSGPVGAKSTRSSTRRAASGLSTDLAGGPGAAAAGGSSSSLANGRDEAATVSYTVEGEGLSEAAAGYERPADTSDWQPFDYALHRFLHGDEATRTAMFKLIPHIAEGSWVIKQSVGTVPVILGNKIKTVYYQTDRYIEACCDVTSSSAAAYITGKCAWLLVYGPLVDVMYVCRCVRTSSATDGCRHMLGVYSAVAKINGAAIR